MDFELGLEAEIHLSSQNRRFLAVFNKTFSCFWKNINYFWLKIPFAIKSFIDPKLEFFRQK